ncbi:hypothetical protein [Ruegeria sp.]|uniref:hypothetical protein n=1 Tax=Ruegeria sp. TaxID=1879320 RepID=UPI003B5BCEAE
MYPRVRRDIDVIDQHLDRIGGGRAVPPLFGDQIGQKIGDRHAFGDAAPRGAAAVRGERMRPMVQRQ